jgi:hypothetical protein
MNGGERQFAATPLGDEISDKVAHFCTECGRHCLVMGQKTGWEALLGTENGVENGGEWGKQAERGEKQQKRRRFKADYGRIRAKALPWHCRCYGYTYDDYD